MAESPRFGRTVQDTARPVQDRWYTGVISARNADTSYAVLVEELRVIYPSIFRVAPDRRRLLIGDRVTLRQRGILLEIV